ncbi:hypothetical protein VC862_24605 [Citrobacter braakii]|uniref:hypothetical protein n=1 Tax=Citrobacter braakii TaxID=57706 RepID=UPI002B253051|nr:hypothetical protein [Citrobacter braakii]MEB1007764.1 hypothetical protein [Citrobacter braakii]
MFKSGWLVLILFILSGCADPSVTEQRDILLKRAPSGYGEPNSKKPLSINLIRGELMANGWETQEFLNRLSKECFDLSYSQSGLCTLNLYNEQLKDNKYKRDYDNCSKNQECAKERETTNAVNALNSKYYIAMARNRYDQATLDREIREMCKAVGIGQRRGISRDQVSEVINQAPGISPENRAYLRDIADACWVLSKNGIQDGASKIQNVY